MAYDLKPEEIRVLGVLIEKSLAVPEYYPMTLSAITAACNQKSNRDPITDYTESDVSAAIALLRRKQLADQAPPERNSRSIRFQHLSEQKFGWNAAQRALMCELMLRGPQTVVELRTHAARMTHLDSIDYARELLAELEQTDPPLVVEMEREPGKRERRFAQLLGGPPTIAQYSHNAPRVSHGGAAPTLSSSVSSGGAKVFVDPLEQRVAELEKTVAELSVKISRLVSELGGSS